MRKTVLIFILLCCSINFAATKEPLEFSDPMGVIRKVPFGSKAMPFPRGSAHHPFHYSKQEIQDKKSDSENVKNVRKEADVETLMVWPEEQIKAVIKNYAGFEITRCPHCKRLYQYGIKLWDWDVSDPNHLKCTNCQTVLPNKQYPADKTVTIVGPDGKKVDYPYHQDEDGVRYFYCSKIQQIAFNKVGLGGILDVAESYLATGDKKYARKIAFLLTHLASIYPTLPFHGPGGGYGETKTGYVEKFYDPNPPHEYMSGKWYNTAPSEVYYPRQYAIAYDLIYHSGALEELSDKLGYDVKQRIERDLLYTAAEMTSELPYILDNYDPHAVAGLATIGRCLNDPKLIRDSIKWLEKLLENTILRDGMWYEGARGYHVMSADGISLACEALYGYSDPKGFTDLKTGQRIDNFDPYTRYPIIKKYFLAFLPIYWPDGSVVTIGDSHRRYANAWQRYIGLANKRWAKRTKIEPLDFKDQSSEILEGMGLVFMRSGKPDHRAQLVFNYGPSAGHHHYDKLSINFYALGDEILAERGYTYTMLRAFTTGTVSHNAVVIDRQSQPRTRGTDVKDLILNLKQANHSSPVQFCQAWGDDIYKQTADSGMYRRSTAMVSVDDKNTYLVDIFKVKGGSQHDYFLHGSCNNEMSIETSISVKPAKGTLQSLSDSPPIDSYSSAEPIELVSIGRSDDGNFQTTFNYTDPDCTTKKLKVHFEMDYPVDVITGKASTIRKAKEQDKNLPKSMTAALCVRSRSIQTTFAAVMEPYDCKPFIHSVTRLKIDQCKMLSVSK